MSWYNNWSDLWGDVSDIAHGKNPTNRPPPVNIPDYGGSTTSPTIPKPFPTGQTSYTNTSADDPTQGNDDPTSDGGGGIDWGSLLGDASGFLKDHAGDILKTGGSAANAYLDYIAKQQALKERTREFDASNQIAQGYQGMTAASQLNRAPLADKGQYLALNNTAPTPFTPRDYTQGLGQIGQHAQGGAAPQLAANAKTAAAYTPGAGGVNTDTLKLILSRIGATTPPAGADTKPGDLKSILDGTQKQTTTQQGALPPGASTAMNGNVTVNYGGQQYTQQQWQAYLAQHPELQHLGY